MTTYAWQLEQGDANGVLIGDVPGASGSVDLSAPADATETFTLDDSLVGSRVRWRVTDGITTQRTGWSAQIAPAGTPPPIVPAPPGSLSSTGTVNVSTAIGNPTNSTYALFHTTYQHVVANSHGIFVVYQATDNGNHDPSSWKLERSTDNGATWTVLRDSAAAGDPQYGSPPAIETDENDNVYVIANYLPQAGESFKGIKLYKFLASNGYTTPQIFTLTGQASGKMTTFLDQTRKWIWICLWSHASSGNPNLFAFDYNGNLQYQRNVFPSFTQDWAPGSPGRNGGLYGPSAHYPAFWVDTQGTVYLAWTSLAFESPTTSFYDVRMVYSPSTSAQFQSGTETWLGPTNGVSGAVSARSVPFCTDDSSASLAARAFPICKLSDTTSEFISGSDAGYWNGSSGHFNYNRMKAFAFNGGRVHFIYESENGSDSRIIQHPESYAQFDMAAHAVTEALRRTPRFHYDTTTAGDQLGASGGGSDGGFVQDTTMAGRLYYVRRDSTQSKIEVLRSDDNGESWWLYARSGTISASPAVQATTAFRYVLSDGSIVGVFNLDGGSGTVYAFRVTPN